MSSLCQQNHIPVFSLSAEKEENECGTVFQRQTLTVTSEKDKEDEVWHIQVTPQNVSAIVVKISKCGIFGCKDHSRVDYLPSFWQEVVNLRNATRTSHWYDAGELCLWFVMNKGQNNKLIYPLSQLQK